MGCNCGGGRSVSPVATPKGVPTNPGEMWEAVFPDGEVKTYPTKRQADAMVAMRGGRTRRLTQKKKEEEG